MRLAIDNLCIDTNRDGMNVDCCRNVRISDCSVNLLGLAQAGAVEIHPWGCRVNRVDQPDRLIFDLDPGEDVPWSAVIEAAREVRDRLGSFALNSFALRVRSAHSGPSPSTECDQKGS
jgi:DNA primase